MEVNKLIWNAGKQKNYGNDTFFCQKLAENRLDEYFYSTELTWLFVYWLVQK